MKNTSVAEGVKERTLSGNRPRLTSSQRGSFDFKAGYVVGTIVGILFMLVSPFVGPLTDNERAMFLGRAASKFAQLNLKREGGRFVLEGTFNENENPNDITSNLRNAARGSELEKLDIVENQISAIISTKPSEAKMPDGKNQPESQESQSAGLEK